MRDATDDYETHFSMIVARTGTSPLDEMREPPVANESTRIRSDQGETLQHLRYILIISCALVVVLFVAIAALVKLLALSN